MLKLSLNKNSVPPSQQNYQNPEYQPLSYILSATPELRLSLNVTR